MKHNKFDEIYTLVKHKFLVLLMGEKGSGKTTIAMQVADKLGYGFYSIPMTRQTTLSHLLGFKTVTGEYSSSFLYEAAVNGGVVLLDELNAADPNVLLCLNTIENGYLSFPCGIVNLHENFRLIATSNPTDERYAARNRLDGATLDRFEVVDIDHDDSLEKELVGVEIYQRIKLLRELLAASNSDIYLSIRDSIRFMKRQELGLHDGYELKLLNDDKLLYQKYKQDINKLPIHSKQEHCTTIDELFNLISST